MVEAAFLEDVALVEDGDAAGDLADEFHVVFDDDDAVFSLKTEEEFAGAFRFFIAHPGGGFIDEKDARFLGEEHSDFEPLLLTVGEESGELVLSICEADCLENFLDGLFVLRGHFVKESLEDAAWAVEGEEEIIEDGVLGVDAGGLEFSGNSESVDFVFGKLGEIDIVAVVFVESDCSFIGPGASGDEVHEGGFSCAIRPNDSAEFALAEVEVEVIDGLKAIEGAGDAFRREDQIGIAVECIHTVGRLNFALRRLTSPTMPSGMKRTTMTKIPPRMRSQDSGKAEVV